MSTSKARLWTQAAAFAFSNGYINGWRKGKIFTGADKKYCLPGLNCYSCPGALAACPIGSLQAVLDSGRYRFSLYVFGIIGMLGMLFGRLICGWICPFGWIQDLLHKIPLFGKKKNLPGHKFLKYLKYAVLAIFVILLPILVKNPAGTGKPWFCEYICPSGTLFGGIPLVSARKDLQAAVGPRFIWKCTLLAAVIILAVRYYRPFCKYLCPLGALYGLANPIASYRLRVNKDACVSCGACQKACGMDIKVWENPNSPECIRCGKCKSTCPNGAITSTWGDWKESITKPDPKSLRPVIDQVSGETAGNSRSRSCIGSKILGCLVTFIALYYLVKSVPILIEDVKTGMLNGITGFAFCTPANAFIPPLIFLLVLGIRLLTAKDRASSKVNGQFAVITLISVPVSILINGSMRMISLVAPSRTFSDLLAKGIRVAAAHSSLFIIICITAIVSIVCCKLFGADEEE